MTAKRAALVLFMASMVLVAACGPHVAPGPSSAPPLEPYTAIHSNPTLVCIRHHESDHQSPPLYDQGYGANNHNRYLGGYQFLQTTWTYWANAAGYPYAAGAQPLWAGIHGEFSVQPWIQDEVAYFAIVHGGTGPWQGDGC